MHRGLVLYTQDDTKVKDGKKMFGSKNKIKLSISANSAGWNQKTSGHFKNHCEGKLNPRASQNSRKTPKLVDWAARKRIESRGISSMEIQKKIPNSKNNKNRPDDLSDHERSQSRGIIHPAKQNSQKNLHPKKIQKVEPLQRKRKKKHVVSQGRRDPEP
jgi:hypothetical protein